MGSILGLDFGTKRIGVAVSDETKTIASPLRTIEFEGREKFLKILTPILTDYQVEAVVVGHPIQMSGEAGISADKIKAHVDWFKIRVDLKWVLWDERLTTAEVEKLMIDADVSRSKRKQVKDQLAAQRILQSYLDCEKNTRDHV